MIVRDSTLPAKLRAYSTPTILNGLKRLDADVTKLQVLDRNGLGCMTPSLGISCGYAVTRTMATRRQGGPAKWLPVPPDLGLLAVQGPRFLAVENVGEWMGPVCIWGEVTSHVHTALDCHAGVTNGPVRDLSEMATLGFQSFAGGVGAGGGIVDLLAINEPVKIGGIEILPGDLLHGDQHGIVKIPLDLAPHLPDAIATHAQWEESIFEVCRRKPLDLDALAAAMKPR